jgi:hypothetical protein
MNLKRGLLRTWVIGSATWLCGLAVFSWWSCTSVALPGPQKTLAAMCRTSLFDDWMSQPSYFGFHDYVRLAASGIAIPAVILILGLGISWAVEGYRA